MTKTYDQGGYHKGHKTGFAKGKQDGFMKGLEDARTAMKDTTINNSETPLNEISLMWRELHCADQLTEQFGQSVALNDHHMECLKETMKSSIWRLEIIIDQQSHPLLLKIFKAPIEAQSLIELNMYRKASKLLSGLMPNIHMVYQGVNGSDVWVFMEFVPQLKGQLIFTPDQFDNIIPALAKFHARMYNDRFYERWEVFADWLPLYHSETETLERRNTNQKTLTHLDVAMSRPELKARLGSDYSKLQRILQKGPEYFPELLQAGKSIIHGDLQTPNIGCNNVGEANWDIKFLDWEGARFAPCWFDMFNLIGVFFAYRKDWRKDEEAVVIRCAHLYAAEMAKYEVIFHEDPVRLYKMAYLQRVLERSLYLQLEWAIEGNKQAFLLEGYLEKINVWGKELGLY
ncbi:MAG: phosphotransferase [Paenibacillaceae bacterium]